MKKISIVGAGYVGISLACLFSKEYAVTIIDTNEEKIDLLKNNQSPLNDPEIKSHFSESSDFLDTSTNLKNVIGRTDLYILCLPTNYDSESNNFDTSILDKALEDISELDPEKIILIKSTVPVGYTEQVKNKFNNKNIIFSPEFLREGRALYDNLYPSRVVVGDESAKGIKILKIFQKLALNEPAGFLMNSAEAESVKLFSNAFLALRVSFFNELDSYAIQKNINTENIIEGVCADKRIGYGYNNPSFDMEDIAFLKIQNNYYNYNNIPQNIITAIVKSIKLEKILFLK